LDIWKSPEYSKGSNRVLPFGSIREDIPGGFGLELISLFLKKVEKTYLGEI
jgi:hypothetical protein